MNFVTSRLVALILATLLYTSTAAWPTSNSSPINTTTPLAAENAALLADPWPARLGIAPYFAVEQLPTPWLRKRECLENGSNFCFENNEGKFCPDCGGCCTLGRDEWCCDEGATCCPGRMCCDAGDTCCGDGCCAQGRSCRNGKCEVPVYVSSPASSFSPRELHLADVFGSQTVL